MFDRYSIHMTYGYKIIEEIDPNGKWVKFEDVKHLLDKSHNSEYVPPTAKSCQNCRRDETDDAQYCVVCENFSQWKPA